MFTGAGPSYSAVNNSFNATTCAVLGHQSLSIPSWLNSDNSITLSLNEVIGLYLLTRTGNVTTVASPTPVGDHSINVSGSVGAVTVVQSGTGAAANYTVSVKTPFKLTGATCSLPVGTVVATFTGAGPSYSAVNYAFNATTCAVLGHQSLSIPSWLNSDNSITLSLNEVIGLYLLKV